jgi:hypothetical protein
MGSRRLLCAALAILVLLPSSRAVDGPAIGDGCGLCLPAAEAPEPVAEARPPRHLTIPGSESPHGAAEACNACHTPDETPTGFNVDPRSCLECHEAQAHRDLIHPTDFAGNSAIAPSFQDAPLSPEGRATCLTCHGKACNIRRDNRAMLRGGPWPRQNDFCFTCHQGQDYAAIYPHDQHATTPLCWLCHHPQEQAEDFAFSAALELPQPDLCLKCHKDVQHEREHIGRILGESRLQPPPAETHADFIRRTGISLPLAGDGSIQCSTCHDPGPSCAANNEGRGLQPKLLRAPREQICYACHDL